MGKGHEDGHYTAHRVTPAILATREKLLFGKIMLPAKLSKLQEKLLISSIVSTFSSLEYRTYVDSRSFMKKGREMLQIEFKQHCLRDAHSTGLSG